MNNIIEEGMEAFDKIGMVLFILVMSPFILPILIIYLVLGIISKGLKQILCMD